MPAAPEQEARSNVNPWKLYRIRDRDGRTLRSFVVVEGRTNDAFLDRHAPTAEEVELMQALVDRHNQDVEAYRKCEARRRGGGW